MSLIISPYRFAGGGVVVARWNPADNGPFMTLSGGNATLTGPVGTGWSSCRSVTSHSSGKWYAENEIAINTAGHQVLGIALSTATLTNFVASDNLGWSIQNDINNTMRGTGAQMSGAGLVAPVAGERNMLALDMDTDPSFHLLWLGSKGSWPGGGDPATGANPTFKIAKTGQAFYLAASLFSSGMSSTVKNQAGENAHTLPAGFAMFG